MMRANRALIALQQLNAGKLDDRLLNPLAEHWECFVISEANELSVQKRVLDCCTSRSPPPDALHVDAALRRLRGAASGSGAVLNSSALDFGKVMKHLRKLGPERPENLPRRGDTFPSHWSVIDLPEEGTRPVTITKVSPKAAAYLKDWKRKMLKEDFQQEREKSGIDAHVDKHFKGDNILELAIRMAKANMLRAVENSVDTVGLFTVVKKCEWQKVGDHYELVVALRLVFDQRRSNCGWRDPPWCGLASVASMTYLDASVELAAPGTTLEYAKGDIPSYFYVLELPADLSEHFCLPGLTADRLRKELAKRSLAVLPGHGQHVALAVTPMGWNWAVFLAQSTIEDVFDQGGARPGSVIQPEQRVTDGAAIPGLAVPAHIEYVDDFGFIGVVDSEGIDESAVTLAAREAKTLLRAAGFGVHKESQSSHEEIIGGEFVNSWLLPHQKKLWTAVAMVEAFLIVGSGPPAMVETILGTLSWYFLIERGALSIFNSVYHFCRTYRHKPRMDIPKEVLRELAAAAAIAPLLGVNLGAQWVEKVYLFDASTIGGAVGCSEATTEELRSEARWASRGGWCVWLGRSEEEIAAACDTMTLGQKIRAPPISAEWDDKSRWRELFRWKWSVEEHINLLEMRCGLAATRHAARSSSSWGKRLMLFTDSMVCLGAFSKGRSSSAGVLHICRRQAALTLAFNIKTYWRHIETDRNHMDGPSRGGPLGVMAKSRPEQAVRGPRFWIEDANQRFEKIVEDGSSEPHGPMLPESGAHPVMLDKLTRIRAPRIQLYRFLHIYSGHRREGDLEDEITRWFVQDGKLCLVTLVDLGFGDSQDMTKKENVDRYLAQAKSGYYDGGHGGPPCALWSRVRFLPGGPPPVRSREHLWGLPNLCAKMRKKVELSNAMLVACVLIIEAIICAGGSGTIEHPADPGKPPFPSIFCLPMLIEMERRVGATRWTFTQCMWGCPAKKLTTITGVADNAAMEEFVKKWCTHKKHEAELCGVDETGHFRTRVAQAYPQAMCKQLALAHFKMMSRTPPHAGVADLSSRLVLQGIAQFREERRAALPPEAPLPQSFLHASG